MPKLDEQLLSLTMKPPIDFSSSFSLPFSQVVHGAFLEPAHRIRKRSINQQLRISLVYDLSVYRLDDDKFALVNVSYMHIVRAEESAYGENNYADDKSGLVVRLNLMVNGKLGLMCDN